jgi:hypothetical protein
MLPETQTRKRYVKKSQSSERADKTSEEVAECGESNVVWTCPLIKEKSEREGNEGRLCGMQNNDETSELGVKGNLKKSRERERKAWTRVTWNRTRQVETKRLIFNRTFICIRVCLLKSDRNDRERERERAAETRARYEMSESKWQ